MEYLSILLLLLVINLILEKRFKVHLCHNLKERIIVVGAFFIIGVTWDTIAIARNHWFFPQGKNVGIYIGLMPLEEYLFIFIVPYSILIIYKIIDSMFLKRFKTQIRKS